MVNLQCRKIYLKNMALHNFDGRYIDSQRNPSKKWAGSNNRHVIDIQQSLQKGEIVLWKC